MSALKSILLTALAVALALDAASQSLLPTHAQVFISRMDLGKKNCEAKHGKFEIDGLITSDKYICTYTSEHKVDHCVASSGKCTTTDTSPPKAAGASAAPAPKAAAAATPAKSLAGTGDVSKSELKAICAKNSAWQFTVENSGGGYSCMDVANGIAVNCKKEKDCTENHVQVHAR